MTFEEFGLHDDILEALYYMNFKEATPIQEQAIPIILDGKDLIGCAQTGTGKTAAFMLPVLDMLAHPERNHTTTLVVVPTRELALQIHQAIQGFSYYIPVHSVAVYGGGDGRDFDLQKMALERGTSIVVGTPGKLLSHMSMDYSDFSRVEHLILDEADRMLDMGFIEDIERILDHLPEKRQNLLFSATMSDPIRRLAKKMMEAPEEITLEVSRPADSVFQLAFAVHDDQKPQLLKHLLADHEEYRSVLVFSSTKKKVNQIIRALKSVDKHVEGISSDFDQKEREAVLSRFRSRKTRILVATDVLSRGIDIKDIDLVINYDVPSDPADYVHRVGRTARAESTGEAITLVNSDDMYKFSRIEKVNQRPITKSPLPKSLGEGPEWSLNKKGRGGKRPYKRRKK
jgi:superfamily II DNA/RNA helicase